MNKSKNKDYGTPGGHGSHGTHATQEWEVDPDVDPTVELELQSTIASTADAVMNPMANVARDSKTDPTSIDQVQLQLVGNLQKELAEATAKAAENWDRLLRANAEMENIRRRTRLDVENANKFANERFSKELLGVVDSLEKALEVVANQANQTSQTGQNSFPAKDSHNAPSRQITQPQDSNAVNMNNPTALENIAAIRDGLELTYKLLLDTLDKFGIKMLDPLGETFNPAKHEALAMQATDEATANSILLVAQKGFTIHDRVLRPARVIVAKPAE